MLGVAWLLGFPLRAAEVPGDAGQRAALYQAEACKVLSGYHWVVARKQPGKFTAVHAAYPGGASFSGLAGYGPQGGRAMPSTVFYLTVTFKPVSVTATRCIAQLVTYHRFQDHSNGKTQLLGPSPANSPEMTKYVQDLLAKAEKRVTHEHPEYRAR